MTASMLILLYNFERNSQLKLRKKLLVAVLFCAVLALAPAPADAQGGSCRACDTNPDRCIDACTVLIDGGLRDARTLSKAFKNRGDAHARKGALNDAAADYGQAIALSPGDTSAINNRGILRNRQGRFDDAIQDFSQAIALAPGRAAFFINRALAHHGKKDAAAALADLDRAIALDPDDPRALNNRAGALMMLGRHDAAIRDLDRAVALDPKYATAYNNRGIALAGKGDFAAAIRDYDRALALRPDYARARENRMKAERRQRQTPAETLDLPPAEPAVESAPVDLTDVPEPAAAPEPEPGLARASPPPADVPVTAAAPPAPAPRALPRAAVETAPAPPPVPSGPSMLERFLALEKTLRAADPATIVRYQLRLRETGHYAGAADGRLSRALMESIAACMQAGCRLP